MSRKTSASASRSTVSSRDPHQAGTPARTSTHAGSVISRSRRAVRTGAPAEHTHGALTTVEDGDEGVAVGFPAHVDEVFEGVVVPGDLGPRAVEADLPQRRGHVRLAGEGVAHRRRGHLRMGRIGGRHRRHGGLVHPGDEQALRVRRPPERAQAVELLGVGEVRQPPRDGRLLLDDERLAGLLARGGRDVQATVAVVRDPGAVRGQASIHRRPRHRDLRGRAARHLDHEHPPGQGDRSPVGRRVRRVRRDACPSLAHALPSCPLRRGQILVVAGEQVVRVGQHALPSGRRRRPPTAGPSAASRIVSGGTAHASRPATP